MSTTPSNNSNNEKTPDPFELEIVDQDGNKLDDFQANDRAESNVDKTLKDRQKKKEDGEEEKVKPTVEELWKRWLKTSPDYAWMDGGQGVVIPMRWRGTRWVNLKDAELEEVVQTFLSRRPGRYTRTSIVSCMSITPVLLKVLGKPRLKVDRSRVLITTNSRTLEVVNGQVRVLRDGLAKAMYIPCHMSIDIPEDRIIRRLVDGSTVEFFDLRDIDALETGLFGQLVRSCFPDDEARAAFREFFGDTISPEHRKAVPVMIGEPDSGKSQILMLAEAMHDKKVAGDLANLTGFDMSHFIGASLLTVDEIPHTLGRANETIFKRLTGGGSIPIKRKYKDTATVQCTWKILAGANRIFELSEKTDAMYTRLRIFDIPQPKVLVKNIADRIINGGRAYFYENGNLIKSEQVKPQLLNVLEWALHGAIAVQMRGDVRPPSALGSASVQASEVLRANSNPFYVFMDETSCRPDMERLVSGEEIYAQYVEWAHQSGYQGHAKVSKVVFLRNYFAPAMKTRYGADWDKGLNRTAVVDRVKGRRARCYAVGFDNLPGVSYADSESVQRSLIRTDSYDDGKIPEQVENASREYKREINEVFDKGPSSVGEWSENSKTYNVTGGSIGVQGEMGEGDE